MEGIPGPECECDRCLYGSVTSKGVTRTEVLVGPGRDASRQVVVNDMGDVIWEIYEATRARTATSFVIFETELADGTYYVQFLSRAKEDPVWWEFASGFYGGGEAFHRTTAEERDALERQGFTDGSRGNHWGETIFLDALEARGVAEVTMDLLERVLGWTPRWPMTMRVVHESHAPGRSA